MSDLTGIQKLRIPHLDRYAVRCDIHGWVNTPGRYPTAGEADRLITRHTLESHHQHHEETV